MSTSDKHGVTATTIKANDIKHTCSLFIYGYKWFYSLHITWSLLFPFFPSSLFARYSTWCRWARKQTRRTVCLLQIMGRDKFCVFICDRENILYTRHIIRYCSPLWQIHFKHVLLQNKIAHTIRSKNDRLNRRLLFWKDNWAYTLTLQPITRTSYGKLQTEEPCWYSIIQVQSQIDLLPIRQNYLFSKSLVRTWLHSHWV